MNKRMTYDGIDPFEHPLDRMLAEIALSIQLPPSLFNKVKIRKRAVQDHLEASVSFRGLIEHFYAQGSMSIDATISSRGTDDEYDLDLVAQLGGCYRAQPPLIILNDLEKALADYPVRKVTR